MAVNGRRCIETCELTNDTGEDWCQVHISLNGELIQPAEAWIDRVPAGATVSVDKIDVTAAASVAACRSAFINIFFSAPSDHTVSAVA